MKRLGLITGALIFAFAMVINTSSAQSFEGVIHFTKTHGKVVNKYNYYIKGDNVRIEEVGDNGEIYGIQLIDIKSNKIWGVSPDKKMYMEVPRKGAPQDPHATVSKTGTKKTILSKSTNEVVVKSNEQSTVVTYWITEGNYTFFTPMLVALNRKDKQAVYFQQIDNKVGALPMKSVEKKTDGTVVSVLEVTGITVGKQDDSLFKIPADYKMFSRD